MIVRNEERNLAGCLGPVAVLFDEIIVVDTGSSDATREIAARFTPHVHAFPWCDDFAAARNESLRHATCDWVMWLDADDRLRPGDVAKLAALLESLDEPPRVFMMDTVSTSFYECEGEWRVTHRRLFRRLPGIAWRGRVHEQLVAGPQTPALETVNSDIEIEHMGYRDRAASRSKLQRNIRLLQMDYAIDPDNPSTLFHLGITHSRAGTGAEARKHLQRLVHTQCSDLELMRRVFGALAELSLNEAKCDEAFEIVRRGLVFFPNDEYLLYLLAQGLYELHRYDEARAALAQVMQGSTARLPYAGGPGHIRNKLAPRKLGAVLRMQEQFAAAEATLQSVVLNYPDETHAWYLLGLVYIDTGDGAKLANVINRLGGCPQGQVFGEVLLAAWHLRLDQLEDAGPVIERAISVAPDWPLPRLLRAEWLSRCGAPAGDQERAFRDLLRVQPGNRYALLRLQHLAAPSAPVASPAGAGTFSEWGTSVIVSAGI
jgi:glycosyltransferase involved in cell wall biosynthesis